MLPKVPLDKADVFYSSIGYAIGWYFVFSLMIISTLPVIFAILFSSWYFFGGLLAYCILGCLITIYLNNSFIIHHHTLYVVNTTFPFRKVTAIDLRGIQHIHVSNRSPIRYLLYCFAIIINHNFITIKTPQSSTAYYCIGLEEDYWEKSPEEPSLDGLIHTLKKHHSSTTHTLD